MRTGIGQWSRHVAARAATLACGVAAVQLVAAAAAGSTPGRDRPADWVAYLLLAASAGLLAAPGRRPWPALAIMALSLVYYGLNYPGGAFTVAPAVALFRFASRGDRVAATLGGLGYAAVLFVAGHLWGRAPDAQGTVWFVVWLLGILGVGEFSRGRREHLLVVRERALHAELTREQEAERRANDERLRIAREVHDLLAHSISVINIQAGVAAHMMDREPAEAKAAISIIRGVSKDVLAELRQTLGVLRGADDPPLAPAPGLQRLDDLIGRAAQSGLEVGLEVRGETRPLPATVDLAAYRIVQESLTNVLRHSGSSRARIVLDFTGLELAVGVEDDGVGALSITEGNGILGMRERVLAADGVLHAGPRPGGGFTVRAVLPVRAPAAS